MEFTVLAIGDVVANAGLDCLHHHLRALKKEYGVHFCIVNGENTANGLGISPHQAEELFDAGADVITLGNHAFSKRDYCIVSGRLPLYSSPSQSGTPDARPRLRYL